MQDKINDLKKILLTNVQPIPFGIHKILFERDCKLESFFKESGDILKGELLSLLIRFFSRFYVNGFYNGKFYCNALCNSSTDGVVFSWYYRDCFYVKTDQLFCNYEVRYLDDVIVKFVINQIFIAPNNNQYNHYNIFVPIRELSSYDDCTKTVTITLDYAPSNDKKYKQIELKLLGSFLDDFVSTLKTKHNLMIKKDFLEKHFKKFRKAQHQDFFIHKELKSFLLKELNYFINNEMINVSNISALVSNSDYLKLLHSFTEVATQIIDILSHFEEVQKKLFLQKKFVVSTDYCITLDRVPEEFYPEIISNQDQIAEWVKLFAIDEPLSMAFLKANTNLVLDTRFFSEDFKARLIGSIENFDEQLDGVLIHSENFQALNFLKERYKEQINCVYIDPPYNTGKDDFVYKDCYQHSTWMTLLYDGINVAKLLLRADGIFTVSLNDNELGHLKVLMDQFRGRLDFISNFIWTTKKGAQGMLTQNRVVPNHEYILVYAADKKQFKFLGVPRSDKDGFHNPDNDPRGPWKRQYLQRWGRGFPLRRLIDSATNITYEFESPYSQEKLDKWVAEGRIVFPKNGVGYPCRKEFLTEYQDNKQIVTYLGLYATRVSTDQFNQLFGCNSCFSTPKPVDLLTWLVQVSTPQGIVLDYFAGSGTTGHAVINLNRADGGKRKYVLVEMADYFDTVLKPRLQKAIYSQDWKAGKPSSRNTGISQCFKYIRLESYEDALNNFGNFNLDLKRPFDVKMYIAEQNVCAPQLKRIDLIESFNYWIGVKVKRMYLMNFKGYAVIDGILPNNKTCLIVWIDHDKLGPSQVADLLRQFNYNNYEIVYSNYELINDRRIASIQADINNALLQLK